MSPASRKRSARTTPARRGRLVAALGMLVAIGVPPCSAGSFRVLADESDLVVLTRKAGIAAAMAHDHAIAATGYEAGLEFTPGDAESARFELRLPVERLIVDDPAVQRRVAPALARLGVRDEPFSELDEEDRSKIHVAMLSEKQLDAERFPAITASARVTGRSDPGGQPESPLPCEIALRLEVRGRAVERKATARYEYREGRLEVEALAAFTFTEFGIRPYSAFLGAVRNRDDFQVYVRIRAVPDESGASDAPAAAPGSE